MSERIVTSAVPPDVRAREPDPATIFDLGMHIGQDTAFYLRKGLRVVAFEAHPELVEQARHRFRHDIANGQLVVVGAAIAGHTGRTRFYLNRRNSACSSLDPATGGRFGAGETANVACMTLPEAMRRYGRPYYLKIDLEGFDSEAAAQLADCPYRPRWLSMEGGHPEDIERLAEFGYRRFALVNQKDVPAESDRWLAAEGQALRYPFPYGASGPFGNDLAQDWLTAEQAIDARRCLTRARLSAIEAELPDLARARAAMLAFGWYDLHAGPQAAVRSPVLGEFLPSRGGGVIHGTAQAKAPVLRSMALARRNAGRAFRRSR